jgi:hypothetical protein
MPEWVNEVLATLGPYWPFVTKVAVIWYLGQFFKKRVWTKARAARGGVWGFMRATLRLHPLAAGALWGLLYPWMPAVELVGSRGGAVNEGLLAAFVTLAGHTALEAVAVNRGWTSVLKVLRETVPERETVPPAKGQA